MQLKLFNKIKIRQGEFRLMLKLDPRFKINHRSSSDYKEENNNIVNPYADTYFSDKIHTLSQAGKYTIIDGAKELFVLGNIHALKYKLISLKGKLKKSK